MQNRFLAFPLLLLAGCAAAPDKPTDVANAEPCVREYRVGSSIPVNNCAPPQTAEERQRMIDNARVSARPGAAPKAGGG